MCLIYTLRSYRYKIFLQKYSCKNIDLRLTAIVSNNRLKVADPNFPMLCIPYHIYFNMKIEIGMSHCFN